MSSFKWERTPSQAFAKLPRQYEQRVLEAGYALATSYAPRIEAWMKQGAPWTDRTSNARQGMTSAAKRNLTSVEITLFYTVTYGIYLEWAHQGRFAIIGPAIDEWAPKFFDDIRRIIT